MGRVLFVALGATLLFFPNFLPAQVVPSHFRHIETNNGIGLYAGYLHADPGRLDLGPRSGLVVVGRYDRLLTGPLLGEVGLGVMSTHRNVYSRPGAVGTPLVHIGEADLLMLLAEAGLRFRFTGPRTWRGLAPYAVLTGGVAANLSGAAEIDEQVAPDHRFSFGPAFAAGFGLGTDFFLSERFAVRAEVRDHFWRLSYPQALIGAEESRSEWRHNFTISLGGSIHF